MRACLLTGAGAPALHPGGGEGGLARLHGLRMCVVPVAQQCLSDHTAAATAAARRRRHCHCTYGRCRSPRVRRSPVSALSSVGRFVAASAGPIADPKAAC